MTKDPLFRFHQGKGIRAPTWRVATKGPIKEGWLKGGWSLDIDSHLHHIVVLDTDTGMLLIKSITWKRPSGEDHFLVEPGRIVARIQLPRAAAQNPLDISP